MAGTRGTQCTGHGTTEERSRGGAGLNIPIEIAAATVTLSPDRTVVQQISGHTGETTLDRLRERAAALCSGLSV